MAKQIDHIKENYRRMSDHEIITLISNESRDLTPEALKALQEEMGERGLDNIAARALEVTTREITAEEFNAYVEIVRNNDCPLCGKRDKKLNGAIYAEAVSIIIVTTLHKEFIIACPDCLDKRVKMANSKTIAFGWWGLPWGIIRTPIALGINNSSLSQNHIAGPTTSLMAFVQNKMAEIEIYKDNKEKIIEMISNC